LPEFLRSVLVVETGKFIGSTELFGELQKFFKGDAIEEKLKKVLNHAETYCKFLNPVREKRKRLSQQLKRFSKLRMTTPYPVLLVLYESEMRAADLELSIQYIESFIVRRAFNSKVSRDLNKVFAGVARGLRNEPKKKLSAKLKQLLIDAKWPDDNDFGDNFVSTAFYANAPAIARYALECLECTRRFREELNLDKMIQVEHIFPQKSNVSDWDPKEVADLKKCLHVMGNLTLTGKNSKLSNSAFSEKKKTYRKSPYWLTESVAENPSWNKVSIDKRGAKLLRLAKKLWPR